jgi:hypothetical protein
MAASMNSRVFWDVAPCSHVEVDRRFRHAYCLHHQDDEVALMMAVVCISETLVNFDLTTWCYIPEDSKLHQDAFLLLPISLLLLYQENYAYSRVLALEIFLY